MKKCFESGSDIHIDLLQIRSTPLGQGLPSPATLLFICPVRGIMPIIDRLQINTNNDDEHHTALVNRQYKNEQGKDTSKTFLIRDKKNFLQLTFDTSKTFFFSSNRVYCSGSVSRRGTVDPWNHRGQRGSQPLQQIIQNTHHQDRKNNYTQQMRHKTNTYICRTLSM